jgi:hypothetical protein
MSLSSEQSTGPLPASEPSADTLVVVSHYFGREQGSLLSLLDQLVSIPGGALFDVQVMVNVDIDPAGMALSSAQEQLALLIKKTQIKLSKQVMDTDSAGKSSNELRHIGLSFRENTGMNLGAWDEAWRKAMPHHKAFLFLQDEVCIRREGWLAACQMRLQSLRGGQGKLPVLIGESINPRWHAPWELLHPMLKARAANYHDQIRAWGLDPTKLATHLRSLIFFTDKISLEMIKGFAIGMNKEQCIAAEIAASCQTRAKGGLVEQLSSEPFSSFMHREWRLDGISKHRQEAIGAK